MPDKKPWDLTSTHSLAAAAEWLRKRSGAQLVLVLRAEDWAFGVDPALLPQEAAEVVRRALVPMQDAMLRGKAKAKE